MIRTENLTKHFKDQIAVNDLSINVRKGSVYGFIGKNGAGKTTTINMILSLLKPTEGKVFINDVEVDYYDELYKERIGVVTDVPIFPEYMSAKEYLVYVGELFNISNPKEKALEVLDFVGLKDTRKFVKGYSRGMKQRLAIGASLMNDPEILIMDEPTSALDPMGRKQVMEIIHKLKHQKTIFYSTHILNDAERVCDTICLIDQGRKLLEADISDLKRDYYKPIYLIKTNDNETLLKLLVDMNYLNVLEEKSQETKYEVIDSEKYEKEFIKSLSNNSIHIDNLEQQEVTLEDIFVKVVQDENIG